MIALYTDALGTSEIDRFSRRLAHLADEEPLDTPVPTCGDWTMADLTWHLLEVQHFWAYIVSNRPAGPEKFVRPERPASAELGAGLRSATTALVNALASGDQDDQAWSWHGDDQSIGFSIRRQSHEALVHCADGVFAAGADLPAVSPQLAADGVDEMVNIMLTGVPPWADLTRTPGVVKLHATDTDDSWMVGFGNITGESPSGDQIDTTTCVLAEGEAPDLTISGAALDLDLWLWGRPNEGPVSLEGAEPLADQLRMPIE